MIQPAASRHVPSYSPNNNVTTLRDHVNQHEASTSDAGSQPSSSRKRARRNASQTLACPYFQEDIFRNRTPKCNSVPAQDMSGVRRHLKRNHRMDVWLCRRCNEDIVGPTEHVRCTTVVSNRRRDEAEIQWKSLYAKLFPSSTSIPSACEFRY
jgi:ribosomal protein L37AE/L43A